MEKSAILGLTRIACIDIPKIPMTPKQPDPPSSTEPTPADNPNPPPPKPLRLVVRNALGSEDFVGKAALLLLTAILSGLLVPLIVSSLQAKRSRNEAILQAQAKLLDDVAEIMLRYETLALDVSWFKTGETANPRLHEDAFKRYSEQVADLVARWRIQAVKARTLTSPNLREMIDAHLMDAFRQQDTPMNQLHGSQANGDSWQKQHLTNVKMLENTNKLIEQIAKDLKLAKDDVH